MKLFKFIIVFQLVFYSCKTQEHYAKLEDCINFNYNRVKGDIGYSKEILLGKNINLFDKINKFEKLLMKNKILESNSRENYLKLIEKTINKKTFEYLNIETKNENPYYYNSQNAIIFHILYDSSLLIVMNNKKYYNELHSTKSLYEKVFQEGYPKNVILKELILKKDFNNKTYRLLLCNLIYQKWRYEFDLDSLSHE